MVETVRFSKVQNAATSPTATGIVQKVYGVTATGSLRLVDVTGTWSDGDPIYVADKLNYNNLVSGQRFKLSDRVIGATSGAVGVIIAIVDDGDGTGKLTFMNQVGTFTLGEDLEVGGTKIAEVEDTTFTELHSYVNGDEIRSQLASQGGIYNNTSLNAVRDANALYTFLMDTFDELGAMDDQVPMSAQVKLQQYTLINNWKMPDKSMRFIESGSIQDETLDNIFTCYQTLGTVEGIGDTAFAATTPLPQIYIEQDGSVIDPYWIAGHIDVLVKVKTNTRPTQKSADGWLINNGTVTIFIRNYTDLYDHFETTTIAGVAPIPLATSDDIDNPTGTHEFDYTLNSGTFTVGEEIVDDTDETKRGIITAVNTGPDNLEFIQTGTTAFANGDNFTGQTSGATGTAGQDQQNLVAGYGTDIVVATVDGYVTYTGDGSNFIEGESCTQTSSNAKGIVMKVETTPNRLYLGNITGTFDATNVITGDTSGETVTSSSTLTSSSTVDKDIGDGNGDQPYNAVIYLNRTGTSAQTLAKMYEWIKYRTRDLETTGEPPYNLLGGKGTETGVQGRIYITLDTTYALVKASPLGTFAGGKYFGARGVFIQDMASADIRNYQLIDANGVLRNPPNLQTLTVTSVVSGDRVAVFRRTSATSGSPIKTDEYTIATFVSGDPFNGSGDTQIKVTTTIATDTPDSGVVRVKKTATGLFNSYSYTSFSGQIFYLSSALTEDLDAGEDAYVPLIQEQATGTSVSVNIIYVADIPLLARVRVKGILPFEVEGTFADTGVTIAAIRTTDTIVS